MTKTKQKNEVKYLSDSTLKQIANEFLTIHNPNNTIPVPIEYIAEYELGISIIPTKDLRRVHGIDAFISSTLDKIILDLYCYENYPERTRFTVAHEIAHAVLHKEFFDQLNIQTESDYIEFQETENIDVKKRIEAQAYVFAGYILLPEKVFNHQFDGLIQDGSITDIEQLRLMMLKLSEQYCVSAECLLRQLQREYPAFIKDVEKLA